MRRDRVGKLQRPTKAGTSFLYPDREGMIPFGFKLAWFEFMKVLTSKAFKIQNIKSRRG